MSILWFIAALVFLILWVSANSASKRTNKENYDRGFAEGQKNLADRLHDELKAKSSTDSNISKIINTARKEYQPEVIQDVSLVESMADEESRESGADEVPFMQQVMSQAPADRTVAQVATPIQPHVAKPVRTKQQDVERNLNVLLYMASFLIIAAAAAFIATSLPPIARLVALWMVIVVFYGVGLILHTTVPYLRPAATAFIGTGLALVPFSGIALSQLGGLSGGWSWFITSVIGIISYLIAALKLKSQVISYLTIAFSLSFAASTVATFSGPFVLYFVVLIVASLLFHILSYVKATWIPDLFKLPITQTSQLLTPLTLLGSLIAYDSMTISSYQLIFWVATLYYAVLWLTDKGIVYETVVRALASIALFTSILDIFNYDFTVSLICFLALTTAQSIYSLLRVNVVNSISRMVEHAWLILTIALLIVTLPLWMNTDITQTGVTVQTALAFILSIAASYKFRSIYYAIPALVASVLLPFMIGRWPGEEAWSVQLVTWVFIAAAAITLGVSYLCRERSYALRGFFAASFWTYTSVAFFSSIAQGSSVAFIYSDIGLIATLALASYIHKQWWIEIFSLILVIPVVSLILDELVLPAEWYSLMVVGFVSLVYALVLLTHHLSGETIRRNAAAIALVAVGGGLISSYSEPETVRQVVFFLALFYVVLGLILRKMVVSSVMKGLFTVTYVVYPLLLLLIASSLGLGWLVVALAVTTATYWLASYIEKVAAVMVFGNIAFVATVAILWSWLKLNTEWYLFGVVWVTSAVFYIASLVHTAYGLDSQRRYIHLIFTWILLGFATLFNFFDKGALGYSAAGSLLAIAGTIIVEGVITKRNGLVELAIYIATFAMQRMVGLAIPEANLVVYGHWWAIIILLVALWRKGPSFTTRLVLATAFITASTGFMALEEGGVYQILFLVEHIGLLVVGALLGASWALWWGLAASALAVLYFLRSSLFLSLLFLGLSLLGIVIWRLIRTHKK